MATEIRAGSLSDDTARRRVSCLLAACLAVAAASRARAEDVIWPAIAAPQQVATDYLMGRTLRVDPAQVGADGKTAIVSATLPGGLLIHCTVNLQRAEVLPSKMEAARWRVVSRTCEGTEP